MFLLWHKTCSLAEQPNILVSAPICTQDFGWNADMYFQKPFSERPFSIKWRIMEIGKEQLLSVSQVASLCGVGHSTVGYWIRENRLRAFRVGKQYSIPVRELALYLKSKGQEIPDELSDVGSQVTGSTIFQNCWQYFDGAPEVHDCDNCIVFKKRVETCFTAIETGSLGCPTDCPDCKYYIETYLPKIQLIQQISSPAAISKDYYLWGGNKPWAELCGVSERDLPGMGIEQVFRTDSLEMVIASIKKSIFGDLSAPKSHRAFFKNAGKGKTAVHISVYRLDDPAEGVLILAEPG